MKNWSYRATRHWGCDDQNGAPTTCDNDGRMRRGEETGEHDLRQMAAEYDLRQETMTAEYDLRQETMTAEYDLRQWRQETGEHEAWELRPPQLHECARGTRPAWRIAESAIRSCAASPPGKDARSEFHPVASHSGPASRRASTGRRAEPVRAPPG